MVSPIFKLSTIKSLITIFLFWSFHSHTQQIDSLKSDNSYGFRFIPSAKENIYGVCLGVVGSEVICNIPHVKSSHGINIQLIGQGFFILLNSKAFSYSQSLENKKGFLVNFPSGPDYKAKHNGIILSPFGTFTNVINGVSLSACASLGQVMNGFSFNLITSKYGSAKGILLAMNNQTNKMVGLQVGLFNKTNHLKGLQIGLWNVNSNRKLPFVNWCF